MLLPISVIFLASVAVCQSTTVGDLGLSFHNAGRPNNGKHCFEMFEGSGVWSDNFLCFNRDYGVKWSNSGPIDDMICTFFYEPSENQNLWNNNYLCVPRDSRFGFTFHVKGRPYGTTDNNCISFSEYDSGWNDNHLCITDSPHPTSPPSAETLTITLLTVDMDAPTGDFPTVCDNEAGEKRRCDIVLEIGVRRRGDSNWYSWEARLPKNTEHWQGELTHEFGVSDFNSNLLLNQGLEIGVAAWDHDPKVFDHYLGGGHTHFTHRQYYDLATSQGKDIVRELHFDCADSTGQCNGFHIKFKLARAP